MCHRGVKSLSFFVLAAQAICSSKVVRATESQWTQSSSFDDDHTVQKTLRLLFEYEGYKVEVCEDGQSALDTFRTASPKAVILDLGLPVLSGNDVCREIRRATISLPIVVLSARTSESDKIMLFELGADDYVTKPFSPRELLARVRAAIRRTSVDTLGKSQRIEFGGACYVSTSQQRQPRLRVDLSTLLPTSSECFTSLSTMRIEWSRGTKYLPRSLVMTALLTVVPSTISF